jgi:hypothetical protein
MKRDRVTIQWSFTRKQAGKKFWPQNYAVTVLVGITSMPDDRRDVQFIALLGADCYGEFLPILAISARVFQWRIRKRAKALASFGVTSRFNSLRARFGIHNRITSHVRPTNQTLPNRLRLGR